MKRKTTFCYRNKSRNKNVHLHEEIDSGPIGRYIHDKKAVPAYLQS